MDNLYSIVQKEGKGQICVALKDIKRGTLIYVDKLERNSAFSRNPPQSDGIKCCTNDCSCFTKLKLSLFNHSCRANTTTSIDGDQIELRVVSKIRKNEEITRNFEPYFLGMKYLKDRQDFLASTFGFTCWCDLCREQVFASEPIVYIYENFQNLKNEVEEAKPKIEEAKNSKEIFETYEKILSCYNEMYNLAKYMDAPREFIFVAILNPGFWAGLYGYIYAEKFHHLERMKYFKKHFGKISKVGEKVAETVIGYDDPYTKQWKEKNQNFDDWYSQNKRVQQLKTHLEKFDILKTRGCNSLGKIYRLSLHA